MEFCPFCHCGVNELAMWIDFIGFSNVVVFEDQHRFEGALDLDNDLLMNFCHEYREMVNDHTRDTRPTIAEALESIGAVHSVPSDIAEELHLFFGRWHDIKQAANRAPIAGETRNVIDDLRTELEVEVEEIKEREYESEEAAEGKDPLHGRDYAALDFIAAQRDDPRSEAMRISMAEHFGEFEYEYREDPHTGAEVVHEDDQVIVVADHTGHELNEWESDFNMTEEDSDAFRRWNHEVARELTDHNWSAVDPVVFDKLEESE